jgi:hypothetical protein
MAIGAYYKHCSIIFQHGPRATPNTSNILAQASQCYFLSSLDSFFVCGGGDEATSLIFPQFKNQCPHTVFSIGLNM